MAGILNTHEMVKDLEAHGFSLPQAEALTAWQVKIAEGTFATKADVLEIKNEMRDLKKDLTHDLTVRMFQAQIAGFIFTVGFIAGLLKLMIH